MIQYTLYSSLAGMFLVASQPVFADGIGIDPLSGGAQLTVIGLLFTLITVILTKMIPAEADRRGKELDRMLAVHKDCTKDINDNIKQMTTEVVTMRTTICDLNESLKQRPCMLDDEVYKRLLLANELENKK